MQDKSPTEICFSFRKKREQQKKVQKTNEFSQVAGGTDSCPYWNLVG